ncbi:MAG: hypothetical protein KME30_09490 [Iphinoe sp. HA4291-MV1]|nr:hypothetical protein [Iphinoe sp. HA4291-MV1]
MFKSRVTKIVIAFSSYGATILTAPQQALAQLRVGSPGVQPGLEENYLQYQISGQDLSRMQVIPGCSVGFGAACNKPAAALQQLVESNNGPSYYDLLMRAAGGEQNFQNFASFYGNNPNLSQIPYASFWQNDNPYIMDGYRYLLGQTVSRTPQAGLGQVTKNFYWAPEGSGNSLDPRSGLLNLKYSYGRLLLEEVAKIPNWKQQIQSQDLPAEAKQYYVSSFSQGLRALNSGNEKQLEHNILELQSMPYSPEGGLFSRPNGGIPPEFNQITGQGLPGDAFVATVPILPDGEAITQEIIPSPEGNVVQGGRGPAFPYWTLAGIPLLLLPFLFSGGDDDDSSDRVAVSPPPGGETPPPGTQPPPGGETPPPGTQPPPGGETPPPGTQPPPGGETPPPGTQPPPGGETPPPGTQPPPGGETPPPGTQPPPGGETPPPGTQPPPGGETPPPGTQPPPGGETPPPGTQPPPGGETPPPGTQPPPGGETPPPGTQPPPGGETPPPGTQPPPGGETPPPGTQPPPGGETPPPGTQPPPGGETPPPGTQPPPGGVQPIPESSTLTPLLLLTMIMSILSYRKWLKQS